MKFYEFGNPGDPTILCLPGNFMTHRQFETIVPMLQKDCHVITVSFDGYDETGETQALVAVDILSCHLHDAAVRIGVPEAARLVCAMDRAYMTGFRHIRYTRTTSVAEGDPCCDYRLSYDEDKE